MDHCLIPSSAQEHYLDPHISPDLIKEWLKEGFTHLHFGAVIIVLVAHVRHRLPTAVKSALLNSTYLKYEHAVLGTVLTTLNTGSIVLTFFPNFNVPKPKGKVLCTLLNFPPKEQDNPPPAPPDDSTSQLMYLSSSKQDSDKTPIEELFPEIQELNKPPPSPQDTPMVDS